MTKKEKLIQIVKFTLFSISAGIIQIVSFELLALLCRGVFSLTDEQYYWNFTFNRKFTFKDASNVPIAMLKVFLFYLVFTPLSTWGGDALVKIGWDDTLVLAITMVINFVTEFIYDDLFVFRKKKVEENENAAE